SEQWHLGEKKLFEKILKEEPQSKKIYIVNNEPKETFMLFAFYHLNDAYLIKEKLQKQDYSYKNIFFTDKKISSLKNEKILIKKGAQNIDQMIENKIFPEKEYLKANDKSGILYYQIN
ncbi:MAG: hypothetical protein N2Z85_00710, partial [Patescibacteria group bacterium]|nr:hypothetical protein [Patescibacteria group bacterium]